MCGWLFAINVCAIDWNEFGGAISSFVTWKGAIHTHTLTHTHTPCMQDARKNLIKENNFWNCFQKFNTGDNYRQKSSIDSIEKGKSYARCTIHKARERNMDGNSLPQLDDLSTQEHGNDFKVDQHLDWFATRLPEWKSAAECLFGVGWIKTRTRMYDQKENTDERTKERWGGGGRG